jgi:hypothetical protein
MKTLLLLIGLFFCSLSYGQTIRQEMNKIERENKVFFVYDSRFNLNVPYNGKRLETMPLYKALDLLFRDSDYAWTQKGSTIILMRKKRRIGKSPINRKPVVKPIKKVPKRYAISGYIRDNNREPLINVNVYDVDSKVGTLSNANGAFSLVLDEGHHRLRFSSLGYKEVLRDINVQGNKLINIGLKEDSAYIDEVIVTGDLNSPLLTSQTGKRTFTAKDFNTEFSLLSSPDVVKTLQRVSGVASGIELASGLFVHGGNSDENLFLLDGTPLYQINHSLGLFSSFNTDIIKNVEFYKSGFPAKYNGRLSSITDIRTKDGDMRHIHGTFSLGLLDGRFSIEGPIIKDKTSFVFSLRRSWMDVFLKPYFSIARRHSHENDFHSFNYLFYDMNAKITYHLNDRSNSYISFYSGLDHYTIKDDGNWDGNSENERNKFKWGSTNVAIGRNEQLTGKLFSTIEAVYTHNHSGTEYFDDNYDLSDNKSPLRTCLNVQHNHSSIDDIGLKADFEFHPTNMQKILFGGSYIFHFFKPQTKQQAYYYNNGEEKNDSSELESHDFQRSQEIGLYVENDFSISECWSTDIGLSYTSFSTRGKIYHRLDPRFSTKFQLRNNLSLKGSFTMTTQYLHRIASTSLDMPTDYWVPTTRNFQPGRSWQLAAGLYYHPRKELLLTLEGFYKRSSHLLEYRHWMGMQPPASRWDKDVADGKGRSYGLEFDGSYHSGKVITNLAYTLSWTFRNYEELGTGWYRDKFDNRHKINVDCRYTFSSCFSMYAAWTFHSGNRITLPDRYIFSPPFGGLHNDNDILKFYSKPNNVALPAYHRIDVGVDFKHKTSRGNERIWNISIYNAYCHLNTMYVKVRENDNGTFSAKSRGYIPIIPSVSYTLKF